MNCINLIGRLTRDCDLKFTPGNGMAVAKFSIAVNRMKKGETDFISCVSFGKTAETISQYVAKGNEIAIQGHLQTGSYEKNGIKVYTSDVVVDRFFFIGNKNSNDNSNGSYSNNNNAGGFDEITPVDDGSMPFK